MSIYGKYKVGQMGPIDKKVKDIILADNSYLVYIDEDDVIQWYTEGYGNFPDHFGEVQNKVSDWESTANNLFGQKGSYAIKTLLAEAYARILDNKDIELARDVIERAAERIRKQGTELLKQYYSVSALVVTILCLLGVFITKCLKNDFIKEFGRDEYILWHDRGSYHRYCHQIQLDPRFSKSSR